MNNQLSLLDAAPTPILSSHVDAASTAVLEDCSFAYGAETCQHGYAPGECRARVIFEWRLQLHLWAHFYYVLDAPLTDDRLYDLNFNDLKAVEAAEPRYFQANSPTAAVGCGCPTCFPERFHGEERAYWAELTAGRDMDGSARKVRKR